MTTYGSNGKAIVAHLECGCVIYGDGTRGWCPSCAPA